MIRLTRAKVATITEANPRKSKIEKTDDSANALFYNSAFGTFSPSNRTLTSVFAFAFGRGCCCCHLAATAAFYSLPLCPVPDLSHFSDDDDDRYHHQQPPPLLAALFPPPSALFSLASVSVCVLRFASFIYRLLSIHPSKSVGSVVVVGVVSGVNESVRRRKARDELIKQNGCAK